MYLRYFFPTPALPYVPVSLVSEVLCVSAVVAVQLLDVLGQRLHASERHLLCSLIVIFCEGHGCAILVSVENDN